MKIQKKFIIIGLLLALSVTGYAIFPKGREPQPIFTTVKRQDIKSTVAASGTLTGTNMANLKFKSSGKLAYLNVKAGDTVFTYQTIAGLDSKLLEIDLQQAQNTLRDKQAIAEKVEDDVKDHSKDETFKQKMDRTAAQVARDNAFDEVKAAQKALDDAVIFSPIAGVVTQTPFIAGTNVLAADLIVQVVDTSSIYFDTDVDEADIDKIAVGQKAQVTLDAYPDKTFAGTVEQIIPQTKQTSSGATVVTVRIKLDQSPVNFINGLSGQSEIYISRAENALIIPIEALGEDDVVILQNEKGQQKVKVISGIQSDTDVEIKEGLQEGDRILLNPK